MRGLLIIGLLLAACNHQNPYSDARQTVTGLRLAATGAVIGLSEDERPHQMAISEKTKASCKQAPNVILCQQQTGKAALDAWEVTRIKIRTAIEGIKAGLEGAEAAIAGAEAAKSGQSIIDAIMAPTRQAIADAATTMQDAGVSATVCAGLKAIGGVR
jgi:hypothetical protein